MSMICNMKPIIRSCSYMYVHVTLIKILSSFTSASTYQIIPNWKISINFYTCIFNDFAKLTRTCCSIEFNYLLSKLKLLKLLLGSKTLTKMSSIYKEKHLQ